MNYNELFRGIATMGAGTLFAIFCYRDRLFPKKSEKEKQREIVRRKIKRAKRLKPIRKMNKFDRYRYNKKLHKDSQKSGQYKNYINAAWDEVNKL